MGIRIYGLTEPQTGRRFIDLLPNSQSLDLFLLHWSTEPYLITIGNHVQLTDGVRIHTHGGGNCVRIVDPTFDCFGKVIIEDWAYIGSGSHIMPGVTIGRGALVAAGSIVTKSVPPGMVAGGNPARIICTVDEYCQKNKKYNINTKGIDADEKKSGCSHYRIIYL